MFVLTWLIKVSLKLYIFSINNLNLLQMATPTLTLTLSQQNVGYVVSYSGGGSSWSSGTLTYTTNPNDTTTYHNINLPWTG